MADAGMTEDRVTMRSERKSLLKSVNELADDHRGWNLAVVLDALSHIADIELFTSRQERFEKQIPILLALRSIAKLRLAGDEIESGQPLRSWKRTASHPNEGNHLEGNAAHRQHAAKGDPSSQKANSGFCRHEANSKRVAYDLQLNRSLERT